MQKLSGLFLFAVLISGAFSSSFAFAQVSVAQNDQYSLNEDSVLTVGPSILINDTNIDNSFFVIIQTGTSFGTLTLNLNGTFTYAPNSNFNSIDSFTYVATNGTHNSNNATVTLSVNPINDAPIAQNNTATTPENTSVIISVLNNDSDVDGDSLTVSSVTQGINGTVTTNGTTITYTPNTNFNGTDSFTYSISDGVILSNHATVTVLVTSIDDETDDDTTPEEKEFKAKLKALKDEYKAKEKELKAKLKALKDEYKAKEKELKAKLKEFKKDKQSDEEKEDRDHKDKEGKGHDKHEDKENGKGHEKFDGDHKDGKNKNSDHKGDD